MNELIALLQSALANNFALYTESHQNHWAVAGPDFPQYHEFLKNIYEDAQSATDTYGERLRQLGAYPGLNPDQIEVNRRVPEAIEIDGPALIDPVEIFQQLNAWIEIIIATLQDAFDAATSVREYGIQNFLADRIDVHKQQQWMIDSILGLNP